jgi:hypothetical protein
VEYNILRKDLASDIAKHFKDSVFDEFFPFYGVAPLFGILPQIRFPVEVQHVEGRGKIPVNVELIRDVMNYSMASVVAGIWKGIIYLTDDHPGFTEGTLETLAMFLEEGNPAKQFSEWITQRGRISNYDHEYQKRGGSEAWKLLDDYMTNGTCPPEKSGYLLLVTLSY